MRIFYVIQDVKTKEYFWQYRIDEGFTAKLNNAKEFNSKDDVIKDMQEDYLQELFENRIIEIKKYYSLS